MQFILLRPKLFDYKPLVQVIAVAIIAGLIWLQIEDIESRIQSRLAVIFFISLFAGGFVPILAAIFSCEFSHDIFC